MAPYKLSMSYVYVCVTTETQPIKLVTDVVLHNNSRSRSFSPPTERLGTRLVFNRARSRKRIIYILPAPLRFACISNFASVWPVTTSSKTTIDNIAELYYLCNNLADVQVECGQNVNCVQSVSNLLQLLAIYNVGWDVANQ